ncbi:MAG: hypothetical protein M1816_004713 [Peltula sp. TS41687]|nr:MAG: hypothetical protein M1816_004713 [Peltula sp. TS41687]
MAPPPVELSIPTTSTSPSPKPHTTYNITIRLPLRSFTVTKRYSDFQALHQLLVTQTDGSIPPAPLPPKSWLTRTITSPDLTEQRRKGLETYLRSINETLDARWRSTSAWRTFLNLPASASSSSSANGSLSGALHASLTSPAGAGPPITDPVVWIDVHRNLKSALHDARIQLQRRDQAQTVHDQHESSAAAKRCLVLAGGMIGALEQGLKALGGGGATTTTQQESHSWKRDIRLGEGELRRRRDLIAAARREKDGLEALANSMAAKAHAAAVPSGGVAATAGQKAELFGGEVLVDGSQQQQQQQSWGVGGAGRGGGRRVLGAPLPETGQTRELENEGVLQLQKQVIEMQDQDVQELTKGVLRIKELGLAINEELTVQKDMLNLLDEDVTRVAGKVQIAKKRIGKIS